MPKTSKPLPDYLKENGNVAEKPHGAPRLSISRPFLSKDGSELDHDLADPDEFWKEKEKRSSTKDLVRLLEGVQRKKELDTMQVFVNVQDDCTLVLNVSEDVTVRQLKAMMQQHVIQIPTLLLGLTYGGKPLKDDLTMRDYNITRNATLMGHWWPGIVE